MTTDLSKVYANLDPAQLALLAFNHLADDNPLERERVLSAVPQRAYLTHDNQFTEMHMSLITTLEKMSSMYWWSNTRYWQLLYVDYDIIKATKTHNAIVLAIQDTIKRLGVVDEVVRVYFMTGEILEPIDDELVDWQLHQVYLDGFAAYSN